MDNNIFIKPNFRITQDMKDDLQQISTIIDKYGYLKNNVKTTIEINFHNNII